MRALGWIAGLRSWIGKRSLDGIADIPWGIMAFLFIASLGGLDLIFQWKSKSIGHLQLKDYLTAIGAGAGLLGIGHGIRTQDRTRRK